MEKEYTLINLKKSDFIYPYFVISGKNKKEKIKDFAGVYRFSVDLLLKDIEEAVNLGIEKILIFGVPDRKDSRGTYAYGRDNIVANAVRRIKDAYPKLIVMTDVCLCAYTSHGHCGILKSRRLSTIVRHSSNTEYGFIDNNATLKVLARIALSHAQAGADYVAPSAMAERQVFAIREELDKKGFKETKIMGYSAKYASNFYGPFRNAADSAPLFGDRSSYQLDYRDNDAAIKEIETDIKEGADIVMVKPALSYLDIIYRAKQKFNVPLAVYNVSGEYAMVKAYCARTENRKPRTDVEKDLILEVLTAIKRAGADLIITYHAKEVARWLTC